MPTGNLHPIGKSQVHAHPSSTIHWWTLECMWERSYTPFVGKVRVARTKQSEAFRVESCGVLETVIDRTAPICVSMSRHNGCPNARAGECTCTPVCFEAMPTAGVRLHLEARRILQKRTRQKTPQPHAQALRHANISFSHD